MRAKDVLEFKIKFINKLKISPGYELGWPPDQIILFKDGLQYLLYDSSKIIIVVLAIHLEFNELSQSVIFAKFEV